MTLRLGIDTGGTYTDAVVMDEACTRVVAKAKVPTTHGALVVGIGSVLDAVVTQPGVSPEAIGLVSLSTTLATNALVEGQGDPASLVLAGFGASELDRLRADAGDDPVVVVTGGHDALGNELASLDPDELVGAATIGGPRISAHAVACQFSVRNPSHELAIAEVLTATTGLPVTCSHELSSRLDGPRRAMTALLNARLIGMIARLETAVDAAITAAGISAPLMVVRGDGSLVSADFVARRPIETILSGPAASVIGARHLAGVGPSGGSSGFGATAATVAIEGSLDGLVVDIGGTTTDIAAVTDGRPTIAPDGAEVAGHRTMVDAIDLVTHGLGGDSEVRFGDDGELALGPARAVPLSRIAVECSEVVELLTRQLGSAPGHGQGRLLVRTGREPARADLDDVERSMLAALAAGPVEEGELATTNRALRRVDRLRRLGLVRVATLTPTDAAILLGSYDPSPPAAPATPPPPLGPAGPEGGGSTRSLGQAGPDGGGPPRRLWQADADGGGPSQTPSAAAGPAVEGAGLGMEAAGPAVEGAGLGMEAARLGAGLLARRRDRRGQAVAASPEALAELIVDALIARSADRLLTAALRADGFEGSIAGPAESLLRAGLGGHRGLVSLTARLGGPIVAVGASAATYYGSVASALGTEVIVPPDADVANAVGAAVGLIRIERQVVITRPRAGRYVIHGLVAAQPASEPVAFPSIEKARAAGEERLAVDVIDQAERAGALPDTIEVEVGWSARTARIEGRELLVEATLTATATGRPQMSPAHRTPTDPASRDS